MTHPTVTARLGRLAPDQRAAATAPPGPVLCVAPAGSGKTTTLVARVAWLVDGGLAPGAITRRRVQQAGGGGADGRLDAALEPLGRRGGRGPGPDVPRARSRDAREAGVSVEPARRPGRAAPRAVPGAIAPADRGRLDLAFSRLKLDLRVTADEVATDPAPGPVARAFVTYERAVAESGGVDFDDLVVRALRLLAGRRARSARVAGAVRRAAGRRGAGPRPDAARARAPARGAGQPRVPRRRRRPDDLRLAPRGRAPRARPGRLAAGPPSGRPRRPTTDARDRSWRARSGSSSTTRSGSRSASWPVRRPRAASSSRPTPRTTWCGSRARCASGRTTGRRVPFSRGRTGSCSSR